MAKLRITDAAALGDIESLKGFLKKKSIETATEKGKTLFLLAAENGQVETVKFLLKQGAKFDVTDESYNNAIHLATGNSQAGMVKYLHSLGVNIDAKNSKKETALLQAIDNQDTNMVKHLCDLGADFAIAKDMQGNFIYNNMFLNNTDIIQYAISRHVESYIPKILPSNDSKSNILIKYIGDTLATITRSDILVELGKQLYIRGEVSTNYKEKIRTDIFNKDTLKAICKAAHDDLLIPTIQFTTSLNKQNIISFLLPEIPTDDSTNLMGEIFTSGVNSHAFHLKCAEEGAF